MRSVSLIFEDKAKEQRDLDISIRMGDITKQPVDAIINAANGQLRHGGGLAAAIVREGGKQVQDESNEYILKYGNI